MLSFEFSVFDLVLSLGVIVLIVLFFTTLWKLNPTDEETKSEGEEAYTEEEESAALPYRPAQVISPQEDQPSRPESWRSAVKPLSEGSPQTQSHKLVVAATTEGSSLTSVEPQRPIEHVEPIKQAKPAASSKRNSKSVDGCPHHFGFLGGLPKNRPIPEECFGCQKIVDCLVTKRKS